MRNFISKKQNLEEAYVDYKIKAYINRYIKELQRHFDVSDKKIRILLYQVYRDLKPFDFIKKFLYTIEHMKKFLTKEIKWK